MPTTAITHTPQKIAIGVLSCAKYEHRRHVVDATWGQLARLQASHFFYVIGDSSLRKPKYVHTASTYYVPVADDYAHLPAKVWWMCRIAKQLGVDYLFKCDDDTYVEVRRLLSCQWSGDFIGGAHRTHRRRLSGGAGYLLSQYALQVVIEQLNGNAIGDEDLLVFDALMTQKIRPTKNDRFRRLKRLVEPHPDNDLITMHYCSVEDMWRIHTAFQAHERIPWDSFG